MKNIIAILALVLISCTSTPPPSNIEVALQKVLVDVGFRVGGETVQLIGTVDEVSSAGELAKLQAAGPDETVLIYIQAIWADPDFVKTFIAAMDGKNTVCFARTASYATFTLFEACQARYIGNDSVLMARRLTVNFQDATLETVESFLPKFKETNDLFVSIESKALGLDRDEYMTLLQNKPLLLNGPSEVLAHKAADDRVNLTCGINGTITRTYKLPPQRDANAPKTIDVTMSACPFPRQLVSPSLSGQAAAFLGVEFDSGLEAAKTDDGGT